MRTSKKLIKIGDKITNKKISEIDKDINEKIRIPKVPKFIRKRNLKNACADLRDVSLCRAINFFIERYDHLFDANAI